MKRLLSVILVAACLWAGYWFIGSSALERGAKTWFTDRANDGWVAEYGALDTVGFPNRFDTTITDVTLADPATGVVWNAPFFQVFAFSYKPNEVIAVWPAEQSFATPFQTVRLFSENLRASAAFEAGTALTLDRATAEMDALRLVSSLGWDLALETGLLATRQTIGGTNSHDIFFEATQFRPDEALKLGLDPGQRLPAALETLSMDLTIGFDAPWDRFAIEDRRPQPTALELKSMRATWGKLELRAAGDVTFDDQGRPSGRITIKATNWREMLDLAVASGLVPEGFAVTARRALEILASLAGPPNTIDAPLTFHRGIVSLGPIPLGPAPRLRLR